MNNEPKYNKETAAAIRKAIEDRLNNGEELTPDCKDIAAYLEVEREIYRIDNPIDTDCRKIKSWDRKKNQILRDVNDTESYKPDETGLARRLVDECKDDTRWNDTNEKWHTWNGKRWSQEKASLLAFKITENICNSLDYELPANMGVEIVTAADKKKHLRIKVNPDFLQIKKKAAQIITRERILRGAKPGLVMDFDSRKDIPFNNGMYDPETGTLTAHTPENGNTTVCPTDLILEDKKDFPAGDKFLKDISRTRDGDVDEEWIKALLLTLGICLMYGNPEHIIIVFYGTGANGKCVLTDWVTSAFGQLVGDCNPMELSTRSNGRETTIFDNVSRCRVLLFKEAGGIKLSDDIVKRLTGEQAAPFTRIHEGSKELPICGTPILISNNFLSYQKGGASIARRLIGFPFSHQVPREQIDPFLIKKLTTKEGNEWLVRRIIETLNEALKKARENEEVEFYKKSLPRRIVSFSDVLVSEGDIVYSFIRDCCTVTKNDKDRVPRGHLYAAFCGYAYAEDGIDPTPQYKRMTQRQFAECLRGYNMEPMEGYQRIGNTCHRYVYSGIQLNEEGLEYLNNETLGTTHFT